MKWVQPTQGANVQGTVSGHGGSQRAAEHPGEVPGRAGPLRGPRPGRRARRRMPRGVPAAGVGAYGGEAERAVALQQRGPRDQPALRLAREGRRDGRRGTHPHHAGHAQGRGPRQERDARRRRARQVRGVGPRAIRGIRPHRPAEAGVALRQAVGPGSLAVHVPVLVDEVAFVLRPRRGGWVIDGTVGMGGHAEAVLRTSGDDVRLLGIDVDPEALARARARLARYAERVTLARPGFRQLARVARAPVPGAAHGGERRNRSAPPDAPGDPRPARPRRTAGRDLVPLGRRPHREADVPCARCRELRGAGAVAPDARGRRGAGEPPRPERQAARAGADVVIKHQRLHREPDPRVRRSFAAALAISAVLVVGALLVVGLRLQQVTLAYQLDALRAERVRTETLIRQLEIEVATLRSPVRVDQRARQLGLSVPARGQVHLAREYVTGTTGLAAAQKNRVAAVEKVATP